VWELGIHVKTLYAVQRKASLAFSKTNFHWIPPEGRLGTSMRLMRVMRQSGSVDSDVARKDILRT
jgi:hypothetical protein